MKFLNRRSTFVLPFCFSMVALFYSILPAQENSTHKAEGVVKAKKPEVTIAGEGKIFTVKVDDELFTTLDCQNFPKPILYPINGPGQVPMTRNWPMKEGVKGEAHDHPHHKSMWISHEISGVDFWAEKGGKVVTDSIEHLGEITPATEGDAEHFNEKDAIRVSSSWIKKSDGQTLLTDKTIFKFGADESCRWIDCTVTFNASHGDIEFDDTKEGLFAIRTHPDLRLKANPKQGVAEVFGFAVNSEGVKGKNVWGKPAKWMLYQGKIDGSPVSIAMFDHPENLRHPTTWHAREYGLVTANPFGLHHFLGKEKGSGAFKLVKDSQLKLRYRIEFIKGLVSVASVENRYTTFSEKPSLARSKE